MTPSYATASLRPVLALCLLAPALGCVSYVDNPHHCANLDGDATCQERHGDALPFCRVGLGDCYLENETERGCVAARPEQDECYSPCGNKSTFEGDTSCLDGGGSSGDSGSSGEDDSSTDTGSSSEGSSSSTTGPMPCMDNEECTEPDAPLCNIAVGECVACDQVDDGDAGCAELDATMPLCVGGECVACSEQDTTVCDEQALVCDTTTNECVPCTEHGQCGEAACNLFDGTCLPAEAVLHVGPGQAVTSIAAAVAMVEPGAMATVVVHGNDSFDESVTVDGERTVAFVANDGDLPRWLASGAGAPQLTATGSTVLLDGLQLSGNGSTMNPGLLADGGRVWADRSRIVDNNGGGVLAQAGAELVLRNCFVGGSVDDADAVRVDGASASILYSTLGAGTTNVAGLSCSTPTAVEVRNSVIVARGIEATVGVDVVCDGAVVSFSATETAVRGEGNTTMGQMPIDSPQDWFEDFGAGNFHLTTPPIAIANTAQWQAGDPSEDIDGNPRPITEGASDFAGADVP